jgi:hypothetical protein
LKKWAHKLSNEFSKEVQMADKYMKKFLTSLAIKEMQIKTALFHFTPIRIAIRTQTTTNVGEGVVKQESLYTVGGTVTLYSHYGKQKFLLFLFCPSLYPP